MRTIAFLALVCASASAAMAKPPEIGTGSNIPGRITSQPGAASGRVPKRVETTSVASTDAALSRARTTAGCAVAAKPADVQLLLSSQDRASFELAAQRLSDTLGKCAIKGTDRTTSEVRFSFGGSTYYGLLSEAWLMKRGMKHVDPAQYDPASQSAQWLAVDESDWVLLRLADCLAHREPARVEFLARSAPGSLQEAEGFAGIQPILGGCLDSNVTLNATKSKLRLALAGALYRRSLEATNHVLGAAN